MPKKFLASDHPGLRYGVFRFFDPKIVVNRFLNLLTTYFFGQNFFFMVKCVSRWVLECRKKKFWNRPKIGDFWPKNRKFWSHLWEVIEKVAPDRISTYLLKTLFKGVSLNRKNKKMGVFSHSSVIWVWNRHMFYDFSLLSKKFLLAKKFTSYSPPKI